MSQKTSNKRNFLFVALSILAIIGVPYAASLLIGGLTISGEITATQGATPDSVLCNQTLAITNNLNESFNCVFTNSDGNTSMQVSCSTSNIVSDTQGCNFENGKDLFFWVSDDNSTWKPCVSTPTFDVPAGETTIYVLADPHPNRCELSGNYTITGSIV